MYSDQQAKKKKGKELSKDLGFNSLSDQNTGYERNSSSWYGHNNGQKHRHDTNDFKNYKKNSTGHNDGHKSFQGNNSKNIYQNLNNMHFQSSRGRGQNTNYEAGFERGDNRSNFNRGRGQSRYSNNYSENGQQRDLTNIQENSSSKKNLRDHMTVKIEGVSDQADMLIIDHTESYENKEIDKPTNIIYETQENFIKSLNEENYAKPMNSKFKNISNSSESKMPVPYPRTSVNKSDDEDGNGARKKQKGNDEKDQINLGFCMSCEKVLTKREFHKDHRVLPINNATAELREIDQNKIVNAIEEINSQLDVEMQTKAIINLHEITISPCLSKVFKDLKASNDNNTHELHEIRDSGLKIMNDSSIDHITNMMKFINFRSESQNVITQNQKLLSDLKQNSCWLIFSWFKISIGLILQSGIKIFAVMKSQTSSSSHAPFDLYGDRLRLFSFQRGITPKKDAMIFPFEPISALFKNEDSKSFMIVANNKEEGQVILRVNKETFWGQQFISLCLGDLGPSLRNIKFFRSCEKGKSGHHIWGGDYSKNNGSGGEAFLPWNEPLKQNSEVIVKGLLAARYGYNDKSTIFRIYIKGTESKSTDPPPKANSCFGYVEEGMETLEYFAGQFDITNTVIKDAGCFLVLK